jgi:signal transduction histidine kinase
MRERPSIDDDGQDATGAADAASAAHAWPVAGTVESAVVAGRPQVRSDDVAERPAATDECRRPGSVLDELGRVRAVIDALPEAVFVTEADGAIGLTNPAADQLFIDEPVQDRHDLLSRFEEIAPGRPRPRATAPGAEDRGPVTVRPRNRPNRWYALRSVSLDEIDDRGAPPDMPDSAEPAADEPAGRTAFVLRDVTDSRDLRPVREAFLAVLSHELRTPITTIYAGSSVLARRPALSPPATRTLARDISAEAARLYDLVEDLLVLARLERQALDPLDETVLVQRAVETTLRLVGDRLADAPIERVGDIDAPPVHGDATYVEQACRNLVFASIRYAGAEPGRRLVVDIRADRSAGEVIVAILDRGPSLPSDELDRVFELPDPSTLGRLSATGVGPFVCRHLVESMGGRVWARNRPSGGLETGFALPIDERS